jgi:hypothetical protein
MHSCRKSDNAWRLRALMPEIGLRSFPLLRVDYELVRGRILHTAQNAGGASTPR